MDGPEMRPPRDEDDLARLEAALAALSGDLGDAQPPQRAALRRALWGSQPSARALLALRGTRTEGAVLFSPVYSTVRGGAGVHVSDLWVAPEGRGQGLGARLLGAAAQQGAEAWAAGWLRLGVYDHSARAQVFYRRLGFRPLTGMQEMCLDAPAFAALGAAARAG